MSEVNTIKDPKPLVDLAGLNTIYNQSREQTDQVKTILNTVFKLNDSDDNNRIRSIKEGETVTIKPSLNIGEENDTSEKVTIYSRASVGTSTCQNYMDVFGNIVLEGPHYDPGTTIYYTQRDFPINASTNETKLNLVGVDAKGEGIHSVPYTNPKDVYMTKDGDICSVGLKTDAVQVGDSIVLLGQQFDERAYILNDKPIKINASKDSTGKLHLLGVRSKAGIEVPYTDNSDVYMLPNGTLTATDFNALSSRKVKTDIKDSKIDAVNLVDSVKVVDFRYINDPETPHVGFIAEDTNTLLSTPKKDKMDYTNCIGILLKAVQELSSRVKELEDKIGD